MFPASYKAARRKEEKIYGPRLMGKLELREGATPPGEEALSLEMRFTDDGGGGHLPQRPGGWVCSLQSVWSVWEWSQEELHSAQRANLTWVPTLHPHILAPAWHISPHQQCQGWAYTFEHAEWCNPLVPTTVSWIVWSLASCESWIPLKMQRKLWLLLGYRNLHKAPYSHRGLRSLHPPRWS